MRFIPIILFLTIFLLTIPNDGFSQEPSPCENACAVCSGFCGDGPCTPECIECILDNCEGPDIPISDHAGVLLACGLIMSSLYFIRRRKVVLN